jgi:hypothetical protein
MNHELTDLTLQAAIQAVVARMNEYEATSALDESSPDRDAELQDYFDHLNTAFSELTDMYLSRVKGNPLLPSLESLLIDPFPLR